MCVCINGLGPNINQKAMLEDDCRPISLIKPLVSLEAL